METNHETLLAQAELKRLEAETKKIELESQEIQNRSKQKWFQGRYFIQSFIGGIVAAALVASWLVKDLPDILDTESRVQEINNRLLKAENEQHRKDLAQQNEIIQNMREAHQLLITRSKTDIKNRENDLHNAENIVKQLRQQLEDVNQQLAQMQRKSNTDSDKRLSELAALSKSVSQGMDKQILELQSQQKVTKSYLEAFDKQKEQLDNVRYIIGFYSLHATDAMHEKIADFLTDLGYTVRNATQLGSRTSWLALKPTVLYYHKESRPKAEALADNLGTITGKQFSIQQGAGLGVSPGAEKWTFFIHYIGEQKNKESIFSELNF